MLRRIAAAVFLTMVSIAPVQSAPVAGAALTAPSVGPPPVLAYYYIWYTPSSWNRAKVDYPLAGRYSSDERRVMERHVEEAQLAGLDGFIVSWKSTPTLDDRLATLISVAQEHEFKLSIIYQGLDFERRPLPTARVQHDLELFADQYASNPVFSLFGKPTVIWSGTWEFAAEEISAVTGPLRDQLHILASERSVDGYERLEGSVDGNAYYWSSVNPQTYPRYPEKLQELSDAVHAGGGLWFAPVAPGFDARLVGGTTVVERRDGKTMREQWNAAVASSPDAISLISWNEFSENSHIEPSERYGTTYLKAVADITGASGPIGELDSSASSGGATGLSGAQALVVMGTLVALASFIGFKRRERIPYALADRKHPARRAVGAKGDPGRESE